MISHFPSFAAFEITAHDGFRPRPYSPMMVPVRVGARITMLFSVRSSLRFVVRRRRFRGPQTETRDRDGESHQDPRILVVSADREQAN